jgi:MFS transporter, AAHS family, 4-hydroxybenzoate transporter
VTGAHSRSLVFLTAITVVFDGIDNQLLGVAIPAVMNEWNLTRSAFAPVVSLGYVGMMLGGALAGMAGDRVGRKRALLGSVATFGLMTLTTAAAHDMTTLAVLRFLAGIGLGGALPNAATLAAEFVTPAKRAMAVTATIVCVPVGGMLVGILGSQFLETIGWRALFILCGAGPLVVAAALTRLLPESPRYLERTHDRKTPRVPISMLFDVELRRDTIALWCSFCSCLFAVYLGFSWLPAVLAGAGFDPGVASSGITAFNLGGVAGALTSGAVMSRVGSRAAMLAMTVGAIGGALTLSLMTISAEAPLAPIMIMLTITGGLINAIQTTMYALATNVYPGSVRASGVGAATAVGRTGAIISGYAGPWALGLRGSASYFALIAGAMVVCFVALASVRRHMTGSRSRA